MDKIKTIMGRELFRVDGLHVTVLVVILLVVLIYLATKPQ